MVTIGMIDNLRRDIIRNYTRLVEIETKLDKVLTRAESLLQEDNHSGLSFTEACRYVGGISRPMMYNLVKDGSIKRSFLIGNRRYFFKEELDRFMECQIDREEAEELG